MSTRIVFMGTPDFAVPVLKKLIEAPEYEVVGVLTQPDRPVGRKRVLTPSPVKVEAQKHGIVVLQPQKVRVPEALREIADLRPDVCVTAAYGQLLPQALLDIPRVGSLNVHASLLPRWRGAAPIHRSIMAGDKETGVTIMEMVLALDAGPMLGVTKVGIEQDDNVGTLHNKLAVQGAALLLDVLPGYIDGSLNLTPQPEEGITYAERLLRSDEFVRFDQSAQMVHNHIRGMSPWPGATAVIGELPIKLWHSRTLHGLPSAKLAPGEIRVLDGRVLVGCMDGCVELLELQPSGKRRMSALDWARGLSNEKIEFQVKGMAE